MVDLAMPFSVRIALLLLAAAAASCHQSCGETGAQGDAGVAGKSAAVGVADCDNYLTKYAQCIERAPSERRKALQDDLDRTRAAWKSLADNPGTRPGLGQSCQLVLDTARENMKQYSCSW
jgi:hypothetical protein